jgi:hypothetical protein
MKISGRLAYSLALAGAFGCSGAPGADLSDDGESVGQVRQDLEAIDVNRELMITDLSVVNDAVRTVSVSSPKPPPNQGVWSFGKLMTNMAGSVDPSDFVLHLFQNWQSDFSLNGATSPARPAIQATVLDPWPKLANGKLDLTKSPMRLLAIVYRPDLLNVSSVGRKQAGEGRFVFGVIGPTGAALPFTIILEYELPAGKPDDVRNWARGFHALGKTALGTPSFNDILTQITAHFAGKGACTDKPNGSCINQIRSNEVTLAAPNTDPNNTPSTKLWELREFHVNPTTHLLDQSAVNQTPDLSFKGSVALTAFINQNEPAILNGTAKLGAALLGPSAKTPKGAFLELGDIANPEARFKFAANTCDGCHSTETNTPFLHVHNRAPDAPAQLSTFLTGGTAVDPVTGQTRTFGDLAARAAEMQWIMFTATDSELGKLPKKKGD